MSVDPPPSGPPTGPPSGPLSGSQPPADPTPHHPWWRSAPRVALLTAAIVAAVIVAVVLSRPGGGGTAKASEVFLQSANETGPDAFSGSTAQSASVAPITPTADASASAPSGALHSVRGGDPGLYAGTRDVPSCDVEKQIKDLGVDPARNKAFASVAGVRPSAVPAYLRSLTPVQLRVDTRVTDHGYRDGAATSFQAVLQTGTAVLVDDHGLPRVRCASGNPLTPPVAQRTAPKTKGTPWPSYRSSAVVVVRPAEHVVTVFTIYDGHHDEWLHRERGDHSAHKDRPTSPPAHPADPWATPSPSLSSSTATTPSSPASSSHGSEPPSSRTSSASTPPSGSSAPPTPSAEPSSQVPSPPASQATPSEPAAPRSSPSGPAAEEETPGIPGVSDTARQPDET